MKTKNKERNMQWIFSFIMFIGLLCVLLPFILKVDMMQFGFALTFIGLIVSIVGFITTLVFRGRAKVFDRMFTGEDLLAHFQYSAECWKKISEEDIADSGIAKIVGFILGAIFFIIGLVLYMIDTYENAMFFKFMLAISIFFIFIGFATAAAEKRRISASKPEAWISKHGVYFKNVLYTWNNQAICYLTNVNINEETHCLVFRMRSLSGGGGTPVHFHRFTLELPIPEGQEFLAENAVAHLIMTVHGDKDSEDANVYITEESENDNEKL